MAQPQTAGKPNGDALGRVTLAIRKILYQQPTSDKVVEMLRGSKSPADALAMCAGFIARLLMKESKNSIPPDIIMPTMEVLMNELGELASACGIKVSDQDKQKAMQLLMQAGQSIVQRAQQPAQQQPQPPAPVTQPQQPPPGIIGSRMAA